MRRDAGPYLFTGREGPLKKRQVQNLFARYAEAAGIKGRSVHSLRHSIAVHLLDAGQKDTEPDQGSDGTSEFMFFVTDCLL